jgi:hypothetical protein
VSGPTVRTLRCSGRRAGEVEIDIDDTTVVRLTVCDAPNEPILLTGMLAELAVAGLEHPQGSEATDGVPLGHLDADGHLVARHRGATLDADALLGAVAAGVVSALIDMLGHATGTAPGRTRS